MTGRRFFQNENKNAVYGNASVNADGIILMVRPVQFLGMMSYFKTYGLTNQYLIMDGWFPEIVQSDSMRDKMFFAESLLVQEDADMNRFTDMHRQILGFSKEYNASLYAYYSYHILKMLIKVLAKDANSHQKLAVLLHDKNYIRTAMPGFTYNGEGEINRMVNIYKIDSPAAKAGMQSGDIITAVNDIQTPDWRSVNQVLSDISDVSRPPALTVRHENGTTEILMPDISAIIRKAALAGNRQSRRSSVKLLKTAPLKKQGYCRVI
ncbi:hypothetical protein CHS0354_035340 [Potamilus streckersoni]|uniref:PDZ domain-containing protein n=1 Tax=Potamilus streckersoni TaxID=2493646 RepID=A0AAE0S315_9BIVA|nr:hypothetical protein CHS0354_035340 [Potamilus streckersoni]